MATAHFKANNLITIVDRNHNMIDGNTEDVMKLEPFADKWTAFGFDVKKVNGSNLKEIADAVEYALARKGDDKPVCIIADTVKGEGINFMEGDYKWHYGAIDEGKYNIAKESLIKHHKARLERVEKEA
ncbi:MAG: hypothetical protein RR123_02090 [Clostridia bacterium]